MYHLSNAKWDDWGYSTIRKPKKDIEQEIIHMYHQQKAKILLEDKKYVPFLKNIGITCMDRMNEIKELLVGIEEIDNQHIEIYDLLCQIVKAKEKNNEEGVMVNVEKLLEIWETHFKFEEDLMEHYKYSGCDEHKKKHDNMREEISNLKKMYSKGFKYVVTIL